MESPFCKIRPRAHIAGMARTILLPPASRRFAHLAAAAVFLLAPGLLRAAADPPLDASDILRSVRESQASRHDVLDGSLRNDSDGKVFPFRLTADGPQVRYQFAGKPPTVVQVRYNEDDSQLEESTGGSTEKLTPANFDKKVLGTDLSYEDLALRFVYWSRAKVTGEDSIRTRDTWKLQLNAPTHHSQYSSVNLWVDKESGALVQAEAYDWQGKLIKRFEVTNVQKIEGKWYLKEMRIETLNPGSDDARSRTYLEIKGLAH